MAVSVFWTCSNAICKVTVFRMGSVPQDQPKCPACTHPCDPEDALVGFDVRVLDKDRRITPRVSPTPTSEAEPTK